MARTLPWFKMHCEALTDAKLRAFTDAQHRCWFSLLCGAAASEEKRGSFTITNEIVAAIEYANGDEEVLRSTLDRMLKWEMLDQDGATFTFRNFEKRNARKPSDDPEEVAKRVNKCREAKAQAEREEAERAAEEAQAADVTRCNALKRDTTPGNAEKRAETPPPLRVRLEKTEYLPPYSPPKGGTAAGEDTSIPGLETDTPPDTATQEGPSAPGPSPRRRPPKSRVPLPAPTYCPEFERLWAKAPDGTKSGKAHAAQSCAEIIEVEGITWEELERCVERYAEASRGWTGRPHMDRFFSRKPEHAGKRGRLFDDYRDDAVADREPVAASTAGPQWPEFTR